MSIATEYSRLIFKRSTLSGVVPTIPTASTIDNTWLSTDLLVGEGFINVADDRFWFRTDNGIIEVDLSGQTANNITTGATLVGDTIYFETPNSTSAYTVNLSSLVITGGTGGNFLPLTVTATTIVNVDNNALLFTGNSASSITTAVVGGDGNNDTFAVVVNDDYALLATQLNNAVENYYVRSSKDAASLEFDTGSTVSVFKVTKSTMRAESSIPTFNGITYAADYSANYTNRSLVDKEYVDGIAFSGISENYLPLTGGSMSGDVSFESGNVIKDSTGNSVLSIEDGYVEFSSFTDASAPYEITDIFYLDPQAFGNGSGIQSSKFDTGTLETSQSQFYLTPETITISSSGDINDYSLSTIYDNTVGTITTDATDNNTSDTSSLVITPTDITLQTKEIDASNADAVFKRIKASVLTGTSISAIGIDSNGYLVSGATSTGGSFLPLTGGTLTGPLVVNSTLRVTGDTIVNELSATTLTLLNSGATTRNYVDYSSNIIRTGVTNSTIAAGSGNTINNNLRNVFVAGINLTATTNDTAYLSKLNIATVPTGTSVNNLGIDASGNVIVGTTGATTSTFPYDISFAISDETTQIATGDTVMSILAARTIEVTKVRASISTTATTDCTFDVLVGGTTILPQNLTIGSGNTSTFVDVTGQTINADTFITVDIGAAGSGATGAKIYILGTTTL